MTGQRSTDIMDARQQPPRRPTIISESARRQRAAITERRLPQATEGRHALPVSPSPNLLSADQRRQRASYTIPEAELKQRTVDALRAEISPEVTEVARRRRLNLLATRALEVIHRAQKMAGDQFVTMPRARIADNLQIAPERAQQLLDSLRQIGALDRRDGLAGQQPRYRVNL